MLYDFSVGFLTLLFIDITLKRSHEVFWMRDYHQSLEGNDDHMVPPHPDSYPKDCFLKAGSNVLPVHISQTTRNEISGVYSFLCRTETTSTCLPAGGGGGRFCSVASWTIIVMQM